MLKSNRTVLTVRAANFLSGALAAAVAKAKATNQPIPVDNSGFKLAIDPNKTKMNGNGAVKRRNHSPRVKGNGYVSKRNMKLLPLKIEVRFNENFHPREIEVKFSRYPGLYGEKTILNSLKADGFRWNGTRKVWFKQDDGNIQYYVDKYTR